MNSATAPSSLMSNVVANSKTLSSKLSSNVGGNLELIQDQDSGILVEPTNHEMFCKKIIELISDKHLREKFTTLSYETVKKYDWKNIGKQYLELYNSLL